MVPGSPTPIPARWPTIAESPQNQLRWRAWFGHMAGDQMLFFWLMNTATILLFMFAALIVLHPTGFIPSQEMLVWDEARLLGEVWGPQGRVLFLFVGIACLFSTQLTLLDGVARSCADLIHSNYEMARRFTLRQWYSAVAVIWMLVGTALTWAWGALPPFMFLLSAGFFGGIAMAFYCPLTLVVNRRFLPPLCRPGPVASVLLGGVSLFYVLFAVTSVWVVGRRLLGL